MGKSKRYYPRPQGTAEPLQGKKVLSTKDGFTCRISPDQLDDYELIDLLARIDSGSTELLPSAIRKMLGDKQHDLLVEHIKRRDGKVSLTAMSKALIELVSSVGETKNS